MPKKEGGNKTIRRGWQHHPFLQLEKKWDLTNMNRIMWAINQVKLQKIIYLSLICSLFLHLAKLISELKKPYRAIFLVDQEKFKECERCAFMCLNSMIVECLRFLVGWLGWVGFWLMNNLITKSEIEILLWTESMLWKPETRLWHHYQLIVVAVRLVLWLMCD